MSFWYRNGTVSISNGSKAVVGSATAWGNQVYPGDAITFDNGKRFYEIASATDNTHLTLVDDFEEATISGGAYRIIPTSPQWSLASELAARIAALLNATTSVLNGTGAPSGALGADGAIYYDTANGYIYGPKASGSWGTGFRYFLPVGLRFTWSTSTSEADPGAGKIRLNHATPGSATKLMISETDADGNAIAAEIAKWATGSSEIKATLIIRKVTAPGAILSVNITGLTDNGGWNALDISGGALAGSLSADDVLYITPSLKGDKGEPGLQGDPGAQGAPGPSYAATSESELSISTGSKDFTTQAGLAYQAGTRIRAASAAAPTVDFMEGVVTAYVGTTLTATIDRIGGSGTHTDWLINLAGIPGADGSGTGDLVAANNLSDLADAEAARLNLGLAIGTHVQAQDAELAALAGLTSAANKIPRFTGSGTAGLLDLDTDGTLAANSDTAVASQRAVKTYVDQIVGAQDAMVFKGIIDCSTNPNYPAADRGWTFRVSVAGKIGGGSGVNVEAGDILLCLTDGTISGNHATVGTAWSLVQANIDGGVIGPASATDSHFAQFNGTTGKLLKGGISLDTDGTLAANSNTAIPSQAAVRTYAQVKHALLTAFSALSAAADKIGYFTGAATMALADLTSFGRSFIALADAAAARSLLGLVIGTHVQAQDAELSALAGLTSAANKIPRFTGSGTADVVELDADTTLSANSDARIASQKATKAYVDSKASALVKLASGTISNAATLDLVLSGYTSYRSIVISLDSLVPATDDVELWMRFSTDGGANYDATGYSYTTVNGREGSTTIFGNVGSGVAQIVIAGTPNANEGVSNVAAEGGASVEVTLIAPLDTSRRTRARFTGSFYGAGTANVFQRIGSADRNAAQDTNAVRILFESGNISSGAYTVYGLT